MRTQIRLIQILVLVCMTLPALGLTSLESRINLKPLEVLVMTDFIADEEFSCEDIPQALLKQQKSANTLYREISQYLGNVSLQYGNWYEQLSPLEGFEYSYALDQFKSLKESVKVGERSVVLWDEISEAFRSQLFVIADSVVACLPDEDQAVVDSIYLDIEKLADESFELDSTVSSFQGLMFNALDEYHKVVSKVEGQTLSLPTNAFKDLKIASIDFHEAGILVSGGFQYLDRRLKVLEASILAKLPKELDSSSQSKSKPLASAP